MKIKRILFTLLTGCLIGFVQTSHAHDPGLSFAKVQVLNNEILMQITFSQKDIDSLISLDSNQDGIISHIELGAGKTDLVKVISEGVDFRINNEQNRVQNISISAASNQSIKAHLSYPYWTQGKLSLAMPIIAQFSRGHRLYLTVRNNQDQSQQQQILSASSATVFINDSVDDAFIFQEYSVEGVWHIWKGFDHILFLVTLLLPVVLVFRNRQWHSVNRLMPTLLDTLKIVTAFTLAHSVTLGLAVFEIVQLPARLVESVIAFSVLVTAVNNLHPVFPKSRWLLACGFGLVHGFGFASALTELGLPAHALLLSLLGFNLGVETGQLAIVVLLIPLAYVIRHSAIYRKWIFSGGSAAAATIASVWMVERIAGFEILGF